MKSTKLLFSSFLFVIVLSFSNCTKDQDIPSTTQDALIRSNWNVDYYFNNQDLTNNYGGYQILFSSTGLLVAQKSNTTVTGSWTNAMAGNSEQVSINFNTSDVNLIQLNRQWKVVNKTSNTIEFVKTDNTTPPETLRIRTQ
jgi:hypothetical protein